MSGALFDFGLFLFHNGRALLDRGSGERIFCWCMFERHERSGVLGPYLYIPKLENAAEAALWAEVFKYTEDKLGLPHGSIKCTVLNEHLLASFQTHEIIHALRDHIIGINFGRWDYLFSYVKVFRAHRRFLLPDRFQLTMTSKFMRSCALNLIHTCHQRGIFAIGGEHFWANEATSDATILRGCCRYGGTDSD